MSLKNQQTTVFFVGSGFDRNATGGQIYNSRVAAYLYRNYAKFTVIEYPWKSFWKNLKFDIKTARTIRSATNPVVIVDESLHQRMALTLFSSLFSPHVKVVMVLHQLSFTRRNSRLARWCTRSIDRLILSRCNTGICAGFYIKNIAQELLDTRHHRKLKLVLATPQNLSSKPASDFRKKNYHACFVGSVVYAKGISYLIEAVKLTTKSTRARLKVSIAGGLSDTKFVSACKQRIMELGIEKNFEWKGILEWSEIQTLYEESELYLFPSLSENMPMSLMEAMNHRVVPIVFDVSAMPLFITHKENGFVCAPRSASSFAKAIDMFFEFTSANKQLLAMQAENSISSYMRSWDELCKEFLEVIRETSEGTDLE